MVKEDMSSPTSSSTKPKPVSSARFRSPLSRENTLNFKYGDEANKYMKRVPFWRRYFKPISLAFGIGTVCIVYSAPLYWFLRDPPEDFSPVKTLWPGERLHGKTYVEQLRERYERIEKRKETILAEGRAKQAAAAAEAEKLKSKN